MSYNKNYLFTHNIDWYACINGTWIYAVSRGGLLPSKVDNEYMLPALQGICANLPDIVDKEDIVINQKLIEIRYKRAIDFYEQRLGDNLENDLDIQEFLNEYPKFTVERLEHTEEIVGNYNKKTFYIVSSIFDLPIKDNSIDCIINIFAPKPQQEFQRVLKNGGFIIEVVPGKNHLKQLKETIYQQEFKPIVEKYAFTKFEIMASHKLTYVENKIIINASIRIL